jgi:hypothetical protein
MTYIRLTGGRDRGSVKDMPFSEAQEMLKLGQALPVNFDEVDPLGFRELPQPILQMIEQKPSESAPRSSPAELLSMSRKSERLKRGPR